MKVIRPGHSQQDPEVVAQTNRRFAVEYVEAKDAADRFEQRRKTLRETILGRIRQFGDTDEQGNQWLPAIDHIMKAERRVSKSFDPAKAEEWLRERGLWDHAKEVIPEETIVVPEREVITEDGLAGYLYQHRAVDDLPSDIPEEFYNVKENFALKVDKEEQYEY